MNTFIKDILIPFLIAVLIYCGFQATMEQYIIHQTSMLPNLVEGQRLFINKLAYLWSKPDRGDIIIFHEPGAPKGIPLIKRIIGLPGEEVEVKSGAVYIDGIVLNEPYIREAPAYRYTLLEVPEGHYFVLGDNRNVSRDSRFGWTVAGDDIIGKALFSVWPPGEWGLAPNYAYSGD